MIKNNEQLIYTAKSIFEWANDMEGIKWDDGTSIFQKAVENQKGLIQLIEATPELKELLDIGAERLRLEDWLNYEDEIVDIINDNLRNWMDEKYGVENAKN